MYGYSVGNQYPLIFSMRSLSSLFILSTEVSVKLAAIVKVFIYMLINPFMACHRHVISFAVATDLFTRPLLAGHFIFNEYFHFNQKGRNDFYSFAVICELLV